MAEIMEVFDDIKEKVGNKGFYILIGVAGLFGLYNLVKGSRSSDNLVPVTTVSSYPDAVTNADTIIDTIQESIDYSKNEIIESMNQGFEATNNYIDEGLASQEKLMEENFDTIQGILDGYTGVTPLPSSGTSSGSSGSSTSSSSSTSSGSSTSSSSSTSSTSKPAGATTTAPTTSTTTTTTTKPTTTTTTTTKKKDTTSYYTYTTKSGLNTSTSIVDALKATGADSSFSNRAKIAEANGISNYTGTASQNVTLLNKLKSGTLKKV